MPADKAALYNRIKNGELPEEFDKAIDDLEAGFEAGSRSQPARPPAL